MYWFALQPSATCISCGKILLHQRKNSMTSISQSFMILLQDLPELPAAVIEEPKLRQQAGAPSKPNRLVDIQIPQAPRSEGEAPNTGVSTTDAAFPAPKLCPICGNKVAGPLPTSLKSKASCDWKERPNSFLSDIVGASGVSRLEEAKESCMQFGSACGGVTCTRGGGSLNQVPLCSCRAAKDARVSPTGEMSYLKVCKSATEAKDCEEEETAKIASRSPFAKDLHGTPIVVVAHNREGELKSCLESLLAMPEVALFQLYVSLDDPAAFVMMEGSIKRVAAAHQKHIDVWKATALQPNVDEYNQEMWKLDLQRTCCHIIVCCHKK
eukprot:symbB.v1.2.026545.t1/scaffold2662.1/size73553/9